MSNFKILVPPSDAHDYVHIVLALRLPGGYCGLGLPARYFTVLAGISLLI